MRSRFPVPTSLLGAALLACILTFAGVPSAHADETAPSDPATPSASTTPIATPSPTPEPTPPTPTPTPTPTEPDCRGVPDTRTGPARQAPFTACSLAVISKKHRVAASYKPSLVTVKVARSGIGSVRLQAAAGGALTRLMAAAKKHGFKLVVRSAYRSWASQKRAYRHDKVLTAPPGASEHQSGLAVDLGAVKHGRLIRGYGFGRSAAGVWTRKHAAAYGFIVRYPNHQKKITGIPYEPWHLRYVGTEAADGVLGTPTKTLERYLRVS